jgi:predicted permease
MNTMIVVAQKALPVFVMLALGMLCRKTKMISREGVAAMKTFAVNITLPAVMLNAFATASYSRESLIVPLVIFSVCVLIFCSLLGGIFLLCSKEEEYAAPAPAPAVEEVEV